MDRALKERIVGATVLVAVAVVVVPVFLDGPADERAVVTETVTLPGQGEQNTRRQTIVLERDRDHPVPPGGAAAGDAGKPQAAAPVAVRKEAPVAASRQPKPQQPSGPEPEPDPEPEPQPKRRPPAEVTAGQKAVAASETGEGAVAASATGMWAVQLGSFPTRTTPNDSQVSCAKKVMRRSSAGSSHRPRSCIGSG